MVANPTDGLATIHDPFDAMQKPKFKKQVADAEKDWEEVTRSLRDYLNSKPTLNGETAIDVWADMVEVNNYIVSIRVIVSIPSKKHSEEFGGASSSHISLRSPFSSYSSQRP